MNEPALYEIRIQGCLADHWSDWFEGVAIHRDAGDMTTLSGSFMDQAALFGILAKIQALNLALISVNRLSCSK